MPTTEWLNKYESIKDKLACKTDLDAHFTEKVIGTMGVDVLDIGTVHFPTGTIFACDPMVELEDTQPFIQTIPAGIYPVKICVVPSEKYGDRYACVKVEVSREKPVRYELGMTGKENLDEELSEDDYFGFGVDAGMGCVADIQTQAAFKTYWAKRLEEDPDIDPYNDLFCDLLEENAKAHPKYQSSYGDWLNWTVPETDCNLPIFASGWGDGYYGTARQKHHASPLAGPPGDRAILHWLAHGLWGGLHRPVWPLAGHPLPGGAGGIPHPLS